MARVKDPLDHLRRWCERRGRITELAIFASTARSTVHRWLSGESIPSPMARIAIETKTGIPRKLWGRA